MQLSIVDFLTVVLICSSYVCHISINKCHAYLVKGTNICSPDPVQKK
jgi:hypothetical protein